MLISTGGRHVLYADGHYHGKVIYRDTLVQVPLLFLFCLIQETPDYHPHQV